MRVASPGRGGAAITPHQCARRRWLVGGAALAAAAVVVAVLVASGRDDSSSVDIVSDPTATESSTTARLASPTTADVEISGPSGLPPIEDAAAHGTISVEGSMFVQSVDVHNGIVWVAPSSGRVQRYYAATGARLEEVPIDSSSFAPHPVFAFGSMWVTRELEDTVWRVDDTTGAVTGSLQLPADIQGLTRPTYSQLVALDDTIGVIAWSTGGADAALYLIDPATMTVQGTLPLAQGAINVVAGFGSLWVTTFDAKLYRLDPTTGAEQAMIDLSADSALNEPRSTEPVGAMADRDRAAEAARSLATCCG